MTNEKGKNRMDAKLRELKAGIATAEKTLAEISIKRNNLAEKVRKVTKNHTVKLDDDDLKSEIVTTEAQYKAATAGVKKAGYLFWRTVFEDECNKAAAAMRRALAAFRLKVKSTGIGNAPFNDFLAEFNKNARLERSADVQHYQKTLIAEFNGDTTTDN